jgi:pyruvate dehydrogenase E1 component beta subunit
MIVDEARDRCSAASHIAALVVERGFETLRAPIRRVTVPNVAIPFSPPLEQAVIPNAARIAAVARGFFARE